MSTAHQSPEWGGEYPPLTPEELIQAGQLGERMLAEFRSLMDKLPPEARSGVGFGRYVQVDRGTATRFVRALSGIEDGLEVLCQLPGVRGLRQVLGGMERLGLGAAHLVPAATAVDGFERLIAGSGGSHSKLIMRLGPALAGREDPERHEKQIVERRRGLFEAASNVLGQRGDVMTTCQVFRPTPGSARMMDHAILRGMFGFRARPDAPPYAFRNFGRNDGPTEAEEGIASRGYSGLDSMEVEGLPGVSVFPEFSSDPLPLVTPRGTGRENVLIIDTERTRVDRGLDIVMAQASVANWRLPALDTPPTHDVSTYIATPVTRMIFDVYLHRSMARECVASAGLYRTTPGIFNNPSEHWYDRLPYAPNLKLIAPARDEVYTPLFPKHAEIFGRFFERLGWDPAEFVGHRLEIEYPNWSGFYSVRFDYTGAR